MCIGSCIPLRSVIIHQSSFPCATCTDVKNGGNDQVAGYLNPVAEVTLRSGGDDSALEAVVRDCSCDVSCVDVEANG
jgi:hypothetical protein